MKETKFNWFYIFVPLLLLAMIFISVKFFQGTGHSSVGITQGNEYKIRSERAAVIKNVHVIPGQQVKSGEVLLTLISPALEIEIDKHANRISVLRSELGEKEKLTQAEIAFIKAEQQIEIEKVNSELLEAESELKLNRKLTKDLTASKDTAANDDPLRMKISSLKQQRKKLEEASSIRTRGVEQQKNTERSLLANEISLLGRELDLMKQEQNELSKKASADGVVGNIFVKAGEEVEAFTSLLSVNAVHPTTVVGYLVGEKQLLPVGTAVKVRSYEHTSMETDGKVIGYGAVVELPVILQKSTAVKAFGREMFVELNAENTFASGEKVLIR